MASDSRVTNFSFYNLYGLFHTVHWKL